MQATLVKTTDQEIYFRFNHWLGWPFLALGLGGIALWPVIEADGRVFYAGFLAILILAGALTVLRRAEVRLDRSTDRWTRKVGFWPNLSKSSGPLSDVQHVVIAGNVTSDSDGDADIKCRVELHFDSAAWEQPLRFGESGNVLAAVELASRVSEPLGIPVEKRFMGVEI